jgi:hypothetical protein
VEGIVSQKSETSESGTFETSCDGRYSVAYGGKAEEVSRT